MAEGTGAGFGSRLGVSRTKVAAAVEGAQVEDCRMPRGCIVIELVEDREAGVGTGLGLGPRSGVPRTQVAAVQEEGRLEDCRMHRECIEIAPEEDQEEGAGSIAGRPWACRLAGQCCRS